MSAVEPMQSKSTWRAAWMGVGVAAALSGVAGCSESADRGIIGGPGIGVASVDPVDAGDAGFESGLEIQLADEGGLDR